MKEKLIYVYAHWQGMELPILIGRLATQQSHKDEVFSFSYDTHWLSSHASLYSLDPDLQLFEGRQYPPFSKSTFGLFLDSSPDRWGRTLMQRRNAMLARSSNKKYTPLRESDYLLGVHDVARMGGIRFSLCKDGPFITEDSPYSSPPMTRLRELEYGISKIEAGTDSDEEIRWLAQLVAPGSSLGGARPKATVVDERGNLWIAKFPSKNDTYDSGAWEMVVHELATNGGIDVPAASCMRFSSHGSTFLVQRFDRSVTKERLHFTSAMALLGKQDGETDASYLELAEFIHRASSAPSKDLHQLFRRIIFNIAVSNSDDHLRNHGFLLTKTGWKLSPAFDLNPVPSSYNLTLAIDEVNHSLDFSLALKQAHFYHLNEKEASAIIEEVKDSVSGWRNIAKDYGLSASQCSTMESAFSL